MKLISGSIDIAKKPQDHSSVQSIIVRDVIDDDTTDNDNSSKWDRHKNKNDLSDEESDIEAGHTLLIWIFKLYNAIYYCLY